MNATICFWTSSCTPDQPLAMSLAVVGIVLVVALAINDYIGPHDKE